MTNTIFFETTRDDDSDSSCASSRFSEVQKLPRYSALAKAFFDFKRKFRRSSYRPKNDNNGFVNPPYVVLSGSTDRKLLLEDPREEHAELSSSINSGYVVSSRYLNPAPQTCGEQLLEYSSDECADLSSCLIPAYVMLSSSLNAAPQTDEELVLEYSSEEHAELSSSVNPASKSDEEVLLKIFSEEHVELSSFVNPPNVILSGTVNRTSQTDGELLLEYSDEEHAKLSAYVNPASQTDGELLVEYTSEEHAQLSSSVNPDHQTDVLFDQDTVTELGTGSDVSVEGLATGALSYLKWSSEMEYFEELDHANLVKPVGYYFETYHQQQVSEFVLREIFEDHPLVWNWHLRMKTVAAVLALPRRIDFGHGNIKPFNVLLDLNYSKRISDFGLTGDYPFWTPLELINRLLQIRLSISRTVWLRDLLCCMSTRAETIFFVTFACLKILYGYLSCKASGHFITRSWPTQGFRCPCEGLVAV